MSDLKALLERADRAVADVPLPADGLEGLERRRDRKQRNRRIRAGTLGVIVAIATAALLGRMIESEHVPAGPPKPLGAGEVLYGGRDVSARDPDTEGHRTIVDAASLPPAPGEEISGAAWSHDRQWVAFRRGSGSQSGGLWVADTVGGAPRHLVGDVGWSPWVWSPIQDQLVYVLGRDVTLSDAATGHETDLGTTVGATDSEGYAVHALVWSPDGTRIAYDGGPGAGSVYSIDVTSGEHTLLVRRPSGTGSIQDIDWSPDGSHLAISYGDALYLANADGSDTRLLDRGLAGGQWPVWHPGLSVGTVWSPVGTRLAYTKHSGPDHRELQVWTASVDGSAPSLVTSHCCVSDGGAPVWSPDGSQIAFIAEEGSGLPLSQLRHYLVVNADGTGDPKEFDKLMYRSWDEGWYFCFCYG